MIALLAGRWGACIPDSEGQHRVVAEGYSGANMQADQVEEPPQQDRFGRPRYLWSAVVALLLVAAVAAVTSLLGDSVTYDETSHLTAGMSYLQTGDFRLAPDHPPLAKLWCAWPLLYIGQHWPPEDDEAWVRADPFALGRRWLFELNDGQRLVLVGRAMMVVVLLAICLTTFFLADALFGWRAGVLALVLAAFSPTLLAHGRLITTDAPITLCVALTLLLFARFLRKPTWARLAAASVALAAASVTKFTWPLVLPALACIGAVAVWRGTVGDDTAEGARGSVGRASRGRQAGVVGGGLVMMLLATWGGIWTCYGWRPTMLAEPAATSPAAGERLEETRSLLSAYWDQALTAGAAGPHRALAARLLRAVADTSLLPEAYVFGLVRLQDTTRKRSAYLMGEYSNTGWLSYFPIAFGIKTPLATITLVLAALVALVFGRAPLRDAALLAGVVAFVLIYFSYAVWSRFNIGHRHLLPIYPLLLALGGAASGLRGLSGRGLVGTCLLWLVATSLLIHPHYLAYFNELVGGASRGHFYLADSNIDWGQDLLRLADYARCHPDEEIKLAYFGSAVPTYYLRCEALPSNDPWEPQATLTPGTYVVSVTQLVGVYEPEVRPGFWNARTLAAHEVLRRLASDPARSGDPPELVQRRAQARQEYESLRARRLLHGLRTRRPDERIGYSLFLYRLTAQDIEELAGQPIEG